MFSNKFILIFLCLYNVLLAVKSNEVKTTTGIVKGKFNEYGLLCYYSYEGIPFANPPVGKLRFKPPVPIKPWKEVLDACAPGPVCPQSDVFYQRSEMSEDCLYLNIYVPVTDSEEPLPVVFFLHGGYFIVESGRPTPIFGPQLILHSEVIVVIPNFRLGALGFLGFDHEEASGNAGLKDILLASKWVKSNIAKFGGDPNQICIYGTGSGGTLAHYLLLTEKSAGIFKSAIICSGSAISYRALQINPKANALKLAQQLGIKYDDDRCLNELREINAFDIVDAEDYLIRNDPRRGFIFINLFAPTIEKPSSNAIITRNPLDIIRTEGLVQKIPIITGFNDQEGLEIFIALRDDPQIVDRLNENFELCIPPNIQYPPKSQERRDLARSIREFYFGYGNITIYNTQNYINLITDTAYAYGIDYWIKLYKNKKTSSSIYYYVFQYDGQLNWAKLYADITYPGVCRGDELGYVFVTNVTENELECINRKSKYIEQSVLLLLKNLAKTGNPTPTSKSGLEWIEAGPNRNYVIVDDPFINVMGPPLKERLGFWYREYAKYYEYQRIIQSKGQNCT